MALEDFRDEQLAEIYLRGRRTVNRIAGDDHDFCIRCPKMKTPKDWIDYVEGESDETYFGQLIETPFFGGMNAKTVEAHLEAIHNNLGEFEETANFGEKEIQLVLSDPEMIHNHKKVKAAVENAKVFAQIVEAYGDFGRFVASYGFYRGHENLLRLKNDIIELFEQYGNANAWSFIVNIGLPGIKPVVHILRIFNRIGLIENDKDEDGAIEAALKMAEAAEIPLEWIDCFVSLGHEDYFYPKSDVCGEKPDCDREHNPCEIRELCNYYNKTH